VPYQGWTLEADEVVALSRDELALLILADIDAAEREASQGPSEQNWIIGIQRAYADRLDAVAACAEAWTWLRSKSLVTWNANQQYGTGWVWITRYGREVLDTGLDYLRAVERLDLELHPALERSVRTLYLRGEFELAVFAAFKEVEVTVRSMANADAALLGVGLMQQVFGPDKALSNPSMERGEAVAEMNLFSGSIGLFKNPASHRVVDFNSPTQASEVVLLADLLLRLLDARRIELDAPVS
jgi:uncharacterized protein (TIGR02391 family)